MKILLTGASGQVGYELRRALQGLGEVVAPDRAELDLCDLDRLRSAIRGIRPDLIINPAAYTAVDQAESEPELALRVNGEAPGVIAEEAKAVSAAVIHFSTDYVFDGRKGAAYVEEDATNPLSVYGRSKLAGERAIQAVGVPHLILRTQWVYGTRGKNFLLTMLRLAAERDELWVVGDQFGAPTWARSLAEVTAHVVARENGGGLDWWRQNSGVYHVACSGSTSWHGFAQAIVERSGLAKKPVVTRIATSDYPTAAERPLNSVLDCRKFEEAFCRMPGWEEALGLCLGG